MKGKKFELKLTEEKIRLAIAIVIAAFVVLVIINLFRTYADADITDKLIKKNKAEITDMQNATVADVEAAVNALDAANNVDATASLRIRYQRMFSTSVILGDSLTEGLTVYKWLTEATVFAQVGGSIIYADETFQKAANTMPQYAFFAYGMNDMGNYRGDANAFIERYTELLRAFKKTSPKTKILVNSISTPTPTAIAGNSSIGHYLEFNEAIKAMCEREKYVYIDISDILPSNPSLYAGDGIHADPSYYPIWMDRMIKAAGM